MSRSWIDSILPLVLPSDGNFSFDSAPRYYDYQFLATRPVGAQKLRLFYYGSLDKLVAILRRPTDDPKVTGEVSARIMFHALQASLAGEVAPGLKQETSLQLNYEQFRTQFGPQYFFCKPAVRSVADLRGLKVRSYTPSMTALLTNLGANPVSLQFSEVYPALQRGVVDCGITSVEVA